MSRLTAEEAAKLLGVKVTTVYAYASRGLLRSAPDEDDSRRRLYYESEVEQLKRRGEAHRGDMPAAASALDWGAPVLETAISAITPAGPKYRGHIARTLAREGRAFEEVVSLLWCGDFEKVTAVLADTSSSQTSPAAAWSHNVSVFDTLDAIRLATLHEGLMDMTRFVPTEVAQWRCGWRAIQAALGVISPENSHRSCGEESLARAMLAAWREEPPTEDDVAALNAALILVADHELNASTFAARVAASTSADLYACIGAALATFTGPRHGGASARAEALFQEIDANGNPERALMGVLRRGEQPVGLDHRLYPHGDPRAVVILEYLEKIPAADEARARYNALSLAAEAMGLGKPNLDTALATLARGLRLPPGSASVIFAIGRMAGWVAHALEQREMGQLLRPRARYIGPAHPR
ncbi:MAG: citrate synthase family protein [Myxococcota bacterium]|nr:citrate synthase family protein [Myxococcota bacterium]